MELNNIFRFLDIPAHIKQARITSDTYQLFGQVAHRFNQLRPLLPKDLSTRLTQDFQNYYYSMRNNLTSAENIGRFVSNVGQILNKYQPNIKRGPLVLTQAPMPSLDVKMAPEERKRSIAPLKPTIEPDLRIPGTIEKKPQAPGKTLPQAKGEIKIETPEEKPTTKKVEPRAETPSSEETQPAERIKKEVPEKAPAPEKTQPGEVKIETPQKTPAPGKTQPQKDVGDEKIRTILQKEDLERLSKYPPPKSIDEFQGPQGFNLFQFLGKNKWAILLFILGLLALSLFRQRR